MKTIKVLDSLVLEEEGVKARLRRSGVQQVHLQQGNLDGACAVYAAFITLIIIGVVEYRQLVEDKGSKDKRTSIARLKKELLETKGMHRNGNYLYHVTEDSLFRTLKSTFSKYICIEHHDRNVAQHIQEYIGQDQPVLMSYSSRGGAHALVAVGFEMDAKNNVSKIFCLDPSVPSPKYTYWNAFIDMDQKARTKYKYRAIDETGGCDVMLNDILIISKRK